MAIILPSEVDGASYPQKQNQEMQLLSESHAFVSQYPYTAISFLCRHKICKTQGSSGYCIIFTPYNFNTTPNFDQLSLGVIG
jgi:hypothetical protein